MNLATLLTDSAAAHPDRPAVRLGEHQVTYAELDEASCRVAALIAERGLGVGDRIGVMLPNVLEFAPIYYGVLRSGAVVVPMNPLLKAREVEFYLSDAEAGLLFAHESAAGEAQSGADRVADAGVEVVTADFLSHLAGREPVADIVERADSDTAVILYTSGTTGKPKGAELTHGNLTRNVEVCQDDLIHLTAEDVVFGGLPLFHSFGQTVTLNTSIGHGACLVLLPRFDPALALDLMAQAEVTVFAGVPTMYNAFLAVPTAPELPSLRTCVSGGAALPVEVLRRFEAAFGCQVLEGYGLSETSPVASFNRLDTGRRAGSIGKPVTGVEMRVVDEQGTQVPDGGVGEIAIRGHNVMKGYWRRPEATAEVLSAEGWFRTGDMGRVDDDGFFFIVDRKKELIIRGGFNVYPREIEEVLYEHPAVAEAAVIGIPHPELGEEIAAAVALKTGIAATPEELREFVKGQVAPYKYPRHIWLRDSLPKGPTGKIQKRDLIPPSDLTDTSHQQAGETR